MPIVSTNLIPEVGRAQSNRGADVWQAMQLIDHGLWDHPAMDPNSCGAMATFSPIGPWPQSEYSSSSPFPLALSINFSGLLLMVPLHQKGTNPEEQQRLSMLGTLDAQNIGVSRYCPSCPCNRLFIPFFRVIGVAWCSQEPVPREWSPRA